MPALPPAILPQPQPTSFSVGWHSYFCYINGKIEICYIYGILIFPIFQRKRGYSKGKLDICSLYTSNYSHSSSFRLDTNIATAEAKISDSQTGVNS
uniref:Uncharacterized protein n=1 Tax=Kalanchoe fedtschenkoi TaxID=63787 RepID=A0A7N0TBZ2_KALFE